MFQHWIEPLNRIAAQMPAAGLPVHKRVLRRRGLLRKGVDGPRTTPLDIPTLRELQDVIDELYG